MSTTPTATQELSPGRAVARTVLAAVVGLFPLVNGVLLAIKETLDEYQDVFLRRQSLPPSSPASSPYPA